MGLDTGLLLFPQSSSLPSGSIMRHFSFDACPLSRDAAAYRFFLRRPCRHCVPLSDPIPGQLAICPMSVPLPCESSQHSHAKRSTTVAVCRPLSLFVRARTKPVEVIGYSEFPLLTGRARQRRAYVANALIELTDYVNTSGGLPRRIATAPCRTARLGKK